MIETGKYLSSSDGKIYVISKSKTKRQKEFTYYLESVNAVTKKNGIKNVQNTGQLKRLIDYKLLNKLTEDHETEIRERECRQAKKRNPENGRVSKRGGTPKKQVSK